MKAIWKRWFKKDASVNINDISMERIMQAEIPEHIAIIMDGNGRWAKKRALPRIAGHKEGMNVVRNMTKIANHLGVKTLTLYEYSTENWKRP